MKRLILIAAVLSLSACASAPPATPLTPQQKFDRACTYARETWTIARPIAGVPKVANAIGESGALAVKALNTLVTTTCTQPLDVADSAAVTQRIYDVAGQVVAMVVDAISQ